MPRPSSADRILTIGPRTQLQRVVRPYRRRAGRRHDSPWSARRAPTETTAALMMADVSPPKREANHWFQPVNDSNGGAAARHQRHTKDPKNSGRFSVAINFLAIIIKHRIRQHTKSRRPEHPHPIRDGRLE